MFVVLLLGVIAAAGYRAYVYEGPPTVTEPGYWVSTHGDDTQAGGPSDPWRTIQHAVATVPANTKIFVREGVYAPFTVDRPNLTVRSAPGERATIQGRSGTRDNVLVSANGVTIADLTVRGCVPKPDADVNITGDHGSGVRVAKVSSKVTISGLTVKDSHGTNSAGLPVGCYGILLTESRDVHVTKNEVFHNGAGIVVSRGGTGVVVDDNDVHDQDVIIQNTAAKDDDFGGYGMAATFVSDKPGPVFQGNTVKRNHGPSTDYGKDGGGIELYDTANTTITGNTFETNDGVMETGTGKGGSCDDNVFTGNRAIGGSGGADFDNDTGMVLRCAAGLVVSGNTFTDMSKFTFLLATGGDFAGKINGMKITGNTVGRKNGTVVFRLQYASDSPTGISIDQNKYQTGKAAFAVVDATWTETAVTFEGWQQRTGYDKNSTIE